MVRNVYYLVGLLVARFRSSLFFTALFIPFHLFFRYVLARIIMYFHTRENMDILLSEMQQHANNLGHYDKGKN